MIPCVLHFSNFMEAVPQGAQSSSPLTLHFQALISLALELISQSLAFTSGDLRSQPAQLPIY